MSRSPFWLFVSALLLLSACAETNSNRSAAENGPTNEFAGSYRGTEVLGGRSFPIRVRISADGKIKITDVENISGTGKLDGANFVIKRARPYQVFEGTVSGHSITGITHGNVAYGDGTFSATRN